MKTFILWAFIVFPGDPAANGWAKVTAFDSAAECRQGQAYAQARIPKPDDDWKAIRMVCLPDGMGRPSWVPK